MTKWRKLDNSAKIFPIDSDKNFSAVYRMSVLLTEEIKHDLLKKAVDKTLESFTSFKVCLKRGFFWYYLEENTKEVLVDEEKNYPCKYIDKNTNNGYLFKVTYYKNKINVDTFHSLTDGSSSIEYIKAILGNNLNMKYYPVLREGAGYNDDTDNAEFASAFGIRKMLMSDEHDRLKTYLTPVMYEEVSNSKNCPLFSDDFSSIFNYKMLFLKQQCNINHTDFAEKLAEYEDISPDIANRFVAAFTGRDTITEFAMKVKSKNIVYSRICRCIMHIILEIRKSMSDSYNNIPYIRLLGFNKTGQQYLGSIKKELDVPFITKAADYKNELIFDLACSDIYAQAVYEKYGYVMKNELQQNIIRI